jgi:5-formyltetrahydrofolate cyclo-ligase
MTKAEIRNLYKEKRAAIHSKEKLMFDDLLLIQFQQLSFQYVHTLLTYWPMANTNEPNTHLYSSYLRHTIPGLRMCYPVANFSSNTMQAVEINEDTIYKISAKGITEPTEGAVITANEIDLVFVPLVAFDKSGFRIGYGKGFYDKYLAECDDDVLKIGFSYFEPVDAIDDVQSFDIPLDYCITPHFVYELPFYE